MERAVAEVDLDAVAGNISVLRARAPRADLMAVVKAEGYGHGMIPVARACLAAGADHLGVALPSEAIRLREAGLTGSVMAWLYTPGDDLSGCVARDVALSVGSAGMLAQVVAAARRAGARARIHLKIDTGLGRNGCPAPLWPALVAGASRHQDLGDVEIVGIWSHLARADEPDSPATAEQSQMFDEALAAAAELGVQPRYRHLANSAGVLAHPGTHHNLVRCGIAIYGLSPGPELGTSAEFGLVPAMRASASVAMVKDVAAGQGVSYGYRYRTSGPTRLALVPVGYADGIPRAGSGKLPVRIAGRRFHVAGTIAMDQLVVDVGDIDVSAGDEVQLFGNGSDGGPTAQDWAVACGTINYEIVTRLGSRIPRRHRGEKS